MLRFLIAFVMAGLVAVGGALAWANRFQELAPVSPPARSSFDAKLVERGEALVSMGFCAVCHTRQGGEAFAGGLPLATPFGTIHSTNITPDAQTGIGAWSEEAFRRSMREGIDRRGVNLYPAFPYDHFTNITDADISAIYAFLMTRKPVRNAPLPNDLRFPFNIRTLVAGWNLLFLRHGPFVPDPAQSPAWNRGAYLAEALGHCGSCHTPRNAFGALRQDAKFAGGEVDGWSGLALNAASPAPVTWTSEALQDYFIKGWTRDHGVASGPMTAVVDLLGDQSDDDLQALATYVLSFQKGHVATAPREDPAAGAAPPADPDLQAGAAIFARTCATCHVRPEISAPLGVSSSMNGPDPRNVLRVIQYGIRPPVGAREHSMPPFAWISDKDLASLTAYLRAQFSHNPPWTGIETAIQEVRAKR